jgi:hypothetical protein
VCTGWHWQSAGASRLDIQAQAFLALIAACREDLVVGVECMFTGTGWQIYVSGKELISYSVTPCT